MKRLLSCSLSLVLALSLVPPPALAEALDEAGLVSQTKEVDLRATQDASAKPSETLQQDEAVAAGRGDGANASEPTSSDAQQGLGDAQQGLTSVQQEQTLTETVAPSDPQESGLVLEPQFVAQEMGIWLKDLDAEYGDGVDNGVLEPMHRYEIQTNKEGWSNTGSIRFTAYNEKTGQPKTGQGPYDVIVNADNTTLDGLFYQDAESGLRLPLPEGYYTITFTGTTGAFATGVGEYSSFLGYYSDLYMVGANDGFIFRDYYGMSQGAFTNDALRIAPAGTTNAFADETIPLGGKLDLDLSVATATDIAGSTSTNSCYLYMYKALDGEERNYSLADLRQQLASDATGEWPSQRWWSSGRTLAEWIVWERMGATAGSNGTTWSLQPSEGNNKAGTLSIRNIDLSQKNGTNPALEPGVYFPVVKMKVGGDTYRFAYNPIEVGTTSAEQQAPTIRTETIPDAMRGGSYSTTLDKRTGAPAGAEAGTFSWAVTAGSLPAGLTLDADSGTISGTPSAGAAAQTFTLTLSETINGSTKTASREFTLVVRDAVTLGTISYPTDTIWTKEGGPNSGGSNKPLHLSVPISADLRDAVLNLQKSVVHYTVTQTSTDGSARDWGEENQLSQVISSDGKTLEIDATIQYDTATVDRIKVDLYLNDNEGNPVMASSADDPSGEGVRLVVSSVVEEPNVPIGGWATFDPLDFGGEAPTDKGRVTVWPYNGTTKPSGATKTLEIDARSGPLFNLAPGEYVFVMEGAAPMLDANGKPVLDGEGYQRYSWVDIMSGSTAARAIAGTHPRQFVFTVGPNQQTRIDHTLTAANYDFHTAQAVFQVAPGSSDYKENIADFEVSWYRYQEGREGDKYVLVGTGSTVALEASNDPLYVEVSPTGRDAAFWKKSGKQPVHASAKSCTVQVDRKSLFKATVTLSNVENRTPAEGETWGLIEVRTPLENGGFASSSVWAKERTVEIPDVTSGSTITYTPPVSLLAGQVSYTVPDDAESDVAVNLKAPLPEGLVTFEELSYLKADDTSTDVDDVEESRKIDFTLDDGRTTVEVTAPHGQGDWTTRNVPFYLADGHRIVIQDKGWGTFAEGGKYTITVKHHEGSATDVMGLGNSGNVSSTAYEATLGANLQATVSNLQVVSPGSVTVPLSNADKVACELLLYDSNGDLVESDSAGSRDRVTTPFLNAGDYTLFAVDANVMPTDKTTTTYRYRRNLEELLRKQHKLDTDKDAPENATSYSRARWVDLNVETGKAKTLDGALALPGKGVGELVDRSASSVTASTDYTNKVSIQMHAELLKDAKLSDDAYLEIATNQRSNEGASGYTNPAALNINGRAVSFTRWNNPFDGTQNMHDGTLRIKLGAAGCNADSFPMDMTLVVPRTNMSSVDVRVWLVSNSEGGVRRSLVGSCQKSVEEISINAPASVAWDSFWVYGETGPKATVALYVNGMRAATTRADEYGFYTAEVPVPYDVKELEEFTVSACSQWEVGGYGHSATSSAATVIYTTELPVVERATMFYQAERGGEYLPIESYYRGSIPAKYRSFYRAVNSEQGDSDAKYFWMVEFANGEKATNVRVNVPRSDGTLSIETAGTIRDAESMIPDVRCMRRDDGSFGPRGDGGRLVRETMLRKDTTAFVSKPTYISYSPNESYVTFDLKEAETCEPYTTIDSGRYVGHKLSDKDKLATFLTKMAGEGYLYTCSTSEECDTFAPADTASQAERLIALPEGSVDQWLMFSNHADGTEADPEKWLKVHHQVATADMSTAQIRAEVKGIRAAADPVIEAFEKWLESDGSHKDTSKTKYKGNSVAMAVGANYTLSSSDDYLIVTTTSGKDMQVETMSTHLLEGESDSYVYQLIRLDKKSYTCTTWSEKHAQRQTVTYTIADECCDPEGAHGMDGVGGIGFTDVCLQWAVLQQDLIRSYAGATGTGGGLSGQSLSPASTDGGEMTLVVQSPPVTGGAKSLAQDHATQGIRKKAGLLSDTEIGQWIQGIRDRKGLDTMGEDYIKNKTENQGGTLGLEDVKEAQFIADNYAKGKAFDLVATGATSGVGTVTDPWTYMPWDYVADEAYGLYMKGKRWWRDEITYRNYRLEKVKALLGKKNNLNYYRYRVDRTVVNDFNAKLQKDEQWLEIVAWVNAKGKHDPSGVVYEAVLSNPVKDATVKLYTYNPVGAVAQFIDSEKFGVEENPQVTGDDGRYQWFVPEGYWQVRVSKDGYDDFSTGDHCHEEQQPVYNSSYEPTGDTVSVWVGDYGLNATNDLDGDGRDDGKGYWMPVLPVQLDVNIPLMSQEAPVVEDMSADEKGVLVTFSKYMHPETVNAAMFTVDGRTPAKVEPVDAEAAGYNPDITLARTFKVTYPDSTVEMPGTKVKVKAIANETAKSYAEKPMNTDAERELTVQNTGAFKSIAVPSATNRVFTAGQQTGVAAGEGYVLAGTASATNAGSYTAWAKLVDGYMWADGTRDDKELTWMISAANLSAATVSVANQAYTGGALTPAPTVTLGGRTLVAGTDYTVSYANNVNAGTATATVTGKGNYEGTKEATFDIATPTPQPAARVEMHRLYNPYTGEHFYTASEYERDSLSSVGWSYEGVGWVAPKSSAEPVYRLYNAYAGDHHYTTSAGERDALVAVGWSDEGIGWYSDEARGTPLYRQYNPYATVGTHNYTTSREENDMLVSVGWNAEGIGWYGVA